MQHSLSKSSKRLYIMASEKSLEIKHAMQSAEITEKAMKNRRSKEKEKNAGTES